MPGQPAGGLYSSPTVFNHVIYIGAKTGDFYALDEATGHVLWKRFLGFQPSLTCPALGFVSTAAVVPVANSTGSTTPVVYVAAPDGNLYAMDGVSGGVRWQSMIAKPSSTINDYFNWSSPTILNGRIYIGFASNCDNPLVRGGLMEFDQPTGNPLATYYSVPAGSIGGGVWTSAAATSDSVYITTGSAPNNTPGDSFSIVKLDPTSLSRLAAWTGPIADRAAGDADFGSSPIVFSATLNGVVTPLVGACSKDGYFTALRTGDFSAPLWRFKVGVATSDGGSACLAGGIFDGARLFLAGNETVIRGVDYQGSIREVDPATGSVIWEHGMPANVLGAPSINSAGVIAAATHDYIPPGLPNAAYLIDSGNGSILATINENKANAAEFAQPVFADEFLLRTTTNSMFAYGAPSVTPPPTTGAISGTVTSASSAAAIAGAIVSYSGGASAATDGSGLYTLAGLAPGSYTLTASANGFVSRTLTASVTAGQTTRGVNFSLTPRPPPRKPQLVQESGATESRAATSLTDTFGIPSSAGHLLVLFASVYTGTSNPITSVTDSGGNSWTRIGAFAVGGHYSDGEMWYAANAEAAATVTVQTARPAVISLEVQEFSGVKTASPLEVSTGASNYSTSPGSGSITPTTTGDLMVGFVAGHSSAQAISVITAGYSVGAQQTSNAGGLVVATVITGYQVVTSSSAQDFSGGISSARYWSAGIASFQADPGPGV
jgi:outer membrane protein assembly factor BamB